MKLAADGGGAPPAGDPDAPAEALAWFRSRAPLAHDAWQRLDDDARRRSFTVARVTDLRVLEQVWTALDRAIARGDTFEDFQRSVGAELTAAWGRPNAGRLETVFIDNVQGAYAAGRYAQLTDPDVLDARPYWQFSAVLDARTSDICLPLEDAIRPAGDPWWSTHYPPLHHRCRSTVVSLTPHEAHAVGGVHAHPDHGSRPDEGWGGPPRLGAWQPNLATAPAPLRDAFEARARTEPTP